MTGKLIDGANVQQGTDKGLS